MLSSIYSASLVYGLLPPHTRPEDTKLGTSPNLAELCASLKRSTTTHAHVFAAVEPVARPRQCRYRDRCCTALRNIYGRPPPSRYAHDPNPVFVPPPASLRFSESQINKKYDFLGSAKVCIDLCAAPGGWCQVAAKYMPRGGIILGVDLLPIRAIPNVKTLVHDITTDECRTALKREMQTWKVGID